MISRTFELSELISDCGGLISMRGSVAKVTFASLGNARRFMSLVNRVDPPHQGCSIAYHSDYAVAQIELSPGQFAKQEPDTNFLFLGEASTPAGQVRLSICGTRSTAVWDASGTVVWSSDPANKPITVRG